MKSLHKVFRQDLVNENQKLKRQVGQLEDILKVDIDWQPMFSVSQRPLPVHRRIQRRIANAKPRHGLFIGTYSKSTCLQVFHLLCLLPARKWQGCLEKATKRWGGLRRRADQAEVPLFWSREHFASILWGPAGSNGGPGWTRPAQGKKEGRDYLNHWKKVFHFMA